MSSTTNPAGTPTTTTSSSSTSTSATGTATVCHPGRRDSFALMGSSVAAVATAADTGGAWEMLELTVGPAGRSPLHTLSSDKVFYVADGQITVVVGERDHLLTAGASALVPAGTPHCYRNDGAAAARMLVIATGAGHVAFLRGMSRLTANGSPDPEALREHTAEFGVRILAPQPSANTSLAQR